MYFTVFAEMVEESSSLNSLTEQLWLDDTGSIRVLQQNAADHAFISKFCTHLLHSGANVLDNLLPKPIQVSRRPRLFAPHSLAQTEKAQSKHQRSSHSTKATVSPHATYPFVDAENGQRTNWSPALEQRSGETVALVGGVEGPRARPGWPKTGDAVSTHVVHD